MSLLNSACCCNCKCFTADPSYSNSLPSTLSCAVSGHIGPDAFNFVGMTLYKTGLCEYETYIGDLADCDEYPFYLKHSFVSTGLASDMHFDRFTVPFYLCNADFCGNGPLPGYKLAPGTCEGTRYTAVYVRLSKRPHDQSNFNPCKCWQAEIVYKMNVTDYCGDNCTYQAVAPCTVGYTNHIATDKDALIVKDTLDSIGDNAIANLSAIAIYTGGHPTKCPSSSDINTLCGHEKISSGGLLGETRTLYTNSSGKLLGNYTIGNITPACTSRQTSPITFTYPAFFNFDGDADCVTGSSAKPSWYIDVTSVSIS